MAINLHFPNGIVYNYTEKEFNNIDSITDAIRYLKGVYTNKERFLERFMKVIEDRNTVALRAEMVDLYDKVTPFSFEEAFAIKNDTFRALVFGSINIGEMISNLGSKRIKTDGADVKRKQFAPDGTFLGYKEYHNIYEIYEVDGAKINVTDPLYVVKCWCTSTNKEHWLWIDAKYKDCPLTAIASTFIVAKNIIPHITELKRQGDIMLIELDSDVEPDEKDKRPLTKEEYFKLLTTET
jgi:hypothetical protein